MLTQLATQHGCAEEVQGLLELEDGMWVMQCRCESTQASDKYLSGRYPSNKYLCTVLLLVKR
jgi:hypothetical protein